ncbi:GIY-YIG nuclease family protein [Streptomyces mobaraensis]|uniref:GIY-YIG nuclease family protein n=1 Tax=Streptomyces mobaraensis TaxID=35621 RepID=A0A5N5VWL9_STRMB|nr:GIY-YIG nuclease family protein [Streptomyces mobaraensis]KAB7832513.1 GIY-YIG nuclease family protein [Streptomyces mobaraensis]
MNFCDEPGTAGRTALYRLYDAHDTLLYVGIAGAPRRRWADHARDKGDAWWPEVVTKEVEWFDTRRAATKAELAAILSERPRHNAVGTLHNAHGARVRDGMARKRLLAQIAAWIPLSYRVTARHHEQEWLLDVPDLPGAQARGKALAAAERMLRRQVAQAIQREPDAFTLRLHLRELPPDDAGALRTLDTAQRSAEAAAQAQRSATALTVQALLRHFSLRGAGQILRISYHRVQQWRDEFPADPGWGLPPAPHQG